MVVGKIIDKECHPLVMSVCQGRVTIQCNMMLCPQGGGGGGGGLRIDHGNPFLCCTFVVTLNLPKVSEPPYVGK